MIEKKLWLERRRNIWTFRFVVSFNSQIFQRSFKMMVRSADESQEKRWVELHSYFFPSVPSRDGSFGVLSAILRFSFDGLDGSTMIH